MFTLKEIKANGGATLDKLGMAISYTSGYQVSAEDLEVIPVHKLTKRHLLEMLEIIPFGSNLGIWIYQGKAYIDRSARIGNKRLAIKVGKQLNQISIYDWKTGDFIFCQ